MKWLKAPDALKTLLDKATEGIDCERRLMFGYPAYFINKKMFAGLFQDLVFLRLSPNQRATLKQKYSSLAALEPMPGRPMKDYFVLPRELYINEGSFKATTREAADFARTLPEKAKPKKQKYIDSPLSESEPVTRRAKKNKTKGTQSKARQSGRKDNEIC
jgi:TfoX/Sxy family transcriptional regulator of competence genes